MKKIITEILRKPPFIICFVFVIFFILRSVPEIGIGRYPIGFDTINAYPFYYSSKISFIEAINNSNLFHWLVYWGGIKYPIGDVWMTIKLWGEILFGGLCASFLAYLFYGQKLKIGSALLVTLIFAISLSSLRVSMELFRNELGLIFMFAGLIYLEKISLRVNWQNIFNSLLFILFSLLVIASHQLASGLLVIVLFSKLIACGMKVSRWYVQTLAFLALFLSLALVAYIPESFSVGGVHPWVFLSTISVTDSMPFSVRMDLVISYYLFLYGSLVFFVMIGAMVKKINYFTILFLILTYISITPAIYNGYGFYLWDRWMYFTIIPASYLAFVGIKFISKRVGLLIGTKRQTVLVICLVIVLWKPIAFLYSGTDNSLIYGLRLPDDVLADIFPKGLSDNSLNKFNDPINYNFVEAFNRLNSNNAVTVIDHSFSGLLKVGGIKAPLTESYYGKLSSSDRENLEKRTFNYFVIGDNYGLKNWTDVKTIGTITVYRFDKIEPKVK